MSLAIPHCLVPLTTIVVASVVIFAGLILTRSAVRRGASNRQEETRRILLSVAVATALLGAARLRAFTLSCERQTACGVAWDLNCSTVNRTVFRIGEPVAWGFAIGFVAAEISRRRTR